MTDKVQKIKDWISKEQDGLMDAQGNFEFPEREGAYLILCVLDAYIDSLQEETVSEDLEEVAKQYAEDYLFTAAPTRSLTDHFKAGANWQKQKTIDKAAEWFERLTGLCSFVNDFKKYMED